MRSVVAALAADATFNSRHRPCRIHAAVLATTPQAPPPPFRPMNGRLPISSRAQVYHFGHLPPPCAMLCMIGPRTAANAAAAPACNPSDSPTPPEPRWFTYGSRVEGCSSSG
eukprot:EG_transcript_28085